VFSVVDEFQAKTHHRDTENTEVAQRNQYAGTFVRTRRMILLFVVAESIVALAQLIQRDETNSAEKALSMKIRAN